MRLNGDSIPRIKGRPAAGLDFTGQKALQQQTRFAIMALRNKFIGFTPCLTNQLDIKRGKLMFPEYRDLISKLKQEDAHFARLFNEHNELDDKITGLTNNPVTSGADEIEELKKEKLRLKDALYEILRKADGK